MFEFMEHYDVILVSGPQRAGTRIAAKMIADDTGHTYVDESDIKTASRIKAQQFIEKGPCVIQCPGLSYCIEHFANEQTKKTLVVFMMRNIDDIIRSQDRIGWSCEDTELRKYGLKPDEGPVAAVKYDVWEKQKEDIKWYAEIQYDVLSDHPMWVGDRAGWGWNQTEEPSA